MKSQLWHAFLIVAGVNCLLSKTQNHFCVWTGLFWHDYSLGLRSFSTWDAVCTSSSNANALRTWIWETDWLSLKAEICNRILIISCPTWLEWPRVCKASLLSIVSEVCGEMRGNPWIARGSRSVWPLLPHGSHFHGNPPLTHSPARCWMWIPARSEGEKLVHALGDTDKASCVVVYYVLNC